MFSVTVEPVTYAVREVPQAGDLLVINGHLGAQLDNLFRLLLCPFRVSQNLRLKLVDVFSHLANLRVGPSSVENQRAN